jgi:hypothetical protein
MIPSCSGFKMSHHRFLVALVANSLLGGKLLLSPGVAHAVEFGWQELQDGGIEYLVQVEPSLVDSFRQGGFSSDIPPGLRDVRRIRIVVGEAALPNQGNIVGPKVVHLPPPPVDQPVKTDNPTTCSHAAANSVANSNNGANSKADAEEKSSEGSPASTFGNGESNGKTANSQSAPPALLHPDNPVSEMPFFQFGRAQSTPTTTPVAADRPNEKLPRPQWIGDSGSRNSNESGSGYVAVDAAKPVQESTDVNNSNTPKPWFPLMLTLLGLFLSLGANVYLVWIHQGVRAKYQAMVQQLHGATVTAT